MLQCTVFENIYEERVEESTTYLLNNGHCEVIAVTNAHLHEGLLNSAKNYKTFVCCYLDPENPVRNQLAGSSTFHQSLTSCNNDASDDTSAYCNLANKSGSFASLAKNYVGHMNGAIEKSGQSTDAVWCALPRNFGHGVKCLTMLVPGQDNGSGGIVTYEIVMNSFVHGTHLAAAAGEVRAIDSFSGTSYYLNDPLSKNELRKVQNFWKNLNGQLVVGCPDLFCLFARPNNKNELATSINFSPRFKTDPSKCSWCSC